AASSCAGWIRTGWVRALGRAGFHALGVDLPGHGPQAAPAPPGTTRTGLVDRIGELVSGLDATGPVPLVGYSLGAQLAWAAAARRPGIGALVLGGLGPQDRLPELGRALADDGAVDPAARELAAALTGAGDDGDRRQVERWAGFARLAGGEPFVPAAGVPTQPLLLFAGGRDAWADPGAMARLRDRGQAPTELLVVPERGHVDVLTARAAREGAAAFLRRSVPPRAPGVLP
ncbi:alpha/beta fold hydrolase, partial [Kocuria sp. M4R2S49]|uniref:alpha/beta fold hydrolase n=1 Tax=Kocuria rhizosphaericola TaxID=3376284 RepID=UPI00378C1901